MFAGVGILLGLLLDQFQLFQKEPTHQPDIIAEKSPIPESVPDSIQVIIGTFLGNDQRNFYGNELPDTLEVIWQTPIGKGTTYVRGDSAEEWVGAGWTGQPLLVKVKDSLWLIQGSFDHHLRKINALTGRIAWQYAFDDVIKGTATIWIDPDPESPQDRLLVMQGSRLGNGNYLGTDTIPSFRAISFFTGKEVWRMNVERGPSFSRDVDGSAIVVDTMAYIGLENGLFRKFDPNPKGAICAGDCFYPMIHASHPLYRKGDGARHGGELVVESSPCRIGDRLYITAGSGHVFGYSISKDTVEWDYYIGSDLDGSPVVTDDSCLLITVEKQFILGRGGLLKLDPSKEPEDALVWYLPTADKKLATWLGGVIGSPATDGANLVLCAGLDGDLVVLDHRQTAGEEKGYDGTALLPLPKEVFRFPIGPTISTPIIVNNRLFMVGYHGAFLFEREGESFRLIAKMPGMFESTPICWQGKIYIASRKGYLMCLGRRELSI